MTILRLLFRIMIILMLFFITVLFLSVLIKGNNGRPIAYQTDKSTKVGGPFESSGSTSRYALIESIIEDRSLKFSIDRAKFASPDVVLRHGNYFSIFTPGVSFIGIPFYLLGKLYGFPQLLTYLSTLLIALINGLLVARISKNLGANWFASILAGFLFLFATNALSYSLTFTQHHASTLVTLLGLLSATGKRTWISNIWFGIVYGIGLLIDIPNGITMSPLVIYIIYHQFNKVLDQKVVRYSLNLTILGLLAGLLPFLILFGWYNHELSGSYIKLPQSIGRAKIVSDPPPPLQTESTSLKRSPFNSRNQLHGYSIFFVSSERSIVVYSPIILLGILGLYQGYKKKEMRKKVVVITSIILSSILVYSLFGDPTGSWAFGPRYLIPALALLATGLGIAIQRYNRNYFFLLIFILLSSYSIGVNVLGAMTTTLVPPKVEAVNLPEPIPYTYEYNWQLMTQKNLNSSLVYNLYLKDKISSLDFALIYGVAVFGIVIILYLLSLFERQIPNRQESNK